LTCRSHGGGRGDIDVSYGHGVPWIAAMIRLLGTDGATANARIELDQRRRQLDRVEVVARRVARADAVRAATSARAGGSAVAGQR
jgi:hypothetical protein